MTTRFDCLRHKSPSSLVWNSNQRYGKDRASSDGICLDNVIILENGEVVLLKSIRRLRRLSGP